MAVFGIVMLPRPVVPFGSVIAKDTVVVLVGWYDVILTFDICELVTFPPIVRSTVVPLPVVAGTLVANGVGVGDGVGPGVVVGLGVGVLVGLDVEVGSEEGVAVGEGDGVGDSANVAEKVFEA